jgi:chorismate--pyruvate lyase
MQVACLTPGSRVFDQAVKGFSENPDHIWGRRSVFHFAGQPLLVNEIFLPGIGQCQSGRHAA